jgi:hypothetical protein
MGHAAGSQLYRKNHPQAPQPCPFVSAATNSNHHSRVCDAIHSFIITKVRKKQQLIIYLVERKKKLRKTCTSKKKNFHASQ